MSAYWTDAGLLTIRVTDGLWPNSEVPIQLLNDRTGHRLCENYIRKMKVGNTPLIYIKIDRKVGIRMQKMI